MKQFALIKAYLRDKYQDEEARVIYQDNDKTIFFNNPHLGNGTRIFIFLFGLPFFGIGLLGIYNGVDQLFLNPIELKTINIIFGSILILGFLIISTAFLIGSIYPDKYLVIDSDTKRIKLTLIYPFSIQKTKIFEFAEGVDLKIDEGYRGGDDSHKTWLLEMRLPDKTKFTFWAVNHLRDEQKERVEYWQDKIRETIEAKS